jgi:hypothetical protein
VDNGKRCRVGDWQGWGGPRRGKAASGKPCLLFSQCRQRRLHGALKPLLDDELRLAMAEQNDDRIQAGRD